MVGYLLLTINNPWENDYCIARVAAGKTHPQALKKTYVPFVEWNVFHHQALETRQACYFFPIEFTQVTGFNRFWQIAPWTPAISAKPDSWEVPQHFGDSLYAPQVST